MLLLSHDLPSRMLTIQGMHSANTGTLARMNTCVDEHLLLQLCEQDCCRTMIYKAPCVPES